MIRKLVAIQFVRFMTAGRTFPALLGCEDESGTTVGEYVVKLRGTVGEPGLMKELFASRLARLFRLGLTYAGVGRNRAGSGRFDR
jgi:hypothetical protein